MSMNLYILISASVSFLTFNILEIIISRSLGNKKIINGLIYAFAVTSVLHFAVFGILAATVISYIIFGLLALLFTLGFFGIATTSLRMQLLTEVYKRGRKGISYPAITKIYNRDIIIKKRLERLVAAGEIGKIGKTYQYKRHFSYLGLHSFLHLLINRIFKKENYKF